jgi:hypothetical protein
MSEGTKLALQLGHQIVDSVVGDSVSEICIPTIHEFFEKTRASGSRLRVRPFRAETVCGSRATERRLFAVFGSRGLSRAHAFRLFAQVNVSPGAV